MVKHSAAKQAVVFTIIGIVTFTLGWLVTRAIDDSVRVISGPYVFAAVVSTGSSAIARYRKVKKDTQGTSAGTNALPPAQ